MTKARKWSNLLLLAAIPLVACSGSTDYFQSRDIDHSSWSVTDSVLFPIHIVDEPGFLDPVKWNHDYSLTLTGRYSYDYPYTKLPVEISFERMDSLGWQPWSEPIKVSIPTADNEGYLDGGGWGSLYKMEVPITERKINFPDPGDYRIVILPDTLLVGVISMTVELN